MPDPDNVSIDAGEDISTAETEAVEARAVRLYLRVANLNLEFQEGTAGAKVAKDQAAKVQA